MFDQITNKWNLIEERSKKIIQTFKHKEQAVQYVNQICTPEDVCSLIVNDQIIHKYSE